MRQNRGRLRTGIRCTPCSVCTDKGSRRDSSLRRFVEDGGPNSIRQSEGRLGFYRGLTEAGAPSEGAAGTASTKTTMLSSAHAEAVKKNAGPSWSDVKGSTGNYFSRGSVEVVNPHSGPVFAKNSKLELGEREPTQARTRFWGLSSTQADKGSGGRTEKKAVEADEEHTVFILWSQAAAIGTVALGGGQG